MCWTDNRVRGSRGRKTNKRWTLWTRQRFDLVTRSSTRRCPRWTTASESSPPRAPSLEFTTSSEDEPWPHLFTVGTELLKFSVFWFWVFYCCSSTETIEAGLFDTERGRIPLCPRGVETDPLRCHRGISLRLSSANCTIMHTCRIFYSCRWIQPIKSQFLRHGWAWTDLHHVDLSQREMRTKSASRNVPETGHRFIWENIPFIRLIHHHFPGRAILN